MTLSSPASDAPVDGSEISVFAIASALIRWRRRILIYALIGGALGFVLAFTRPLRYRTSVTFVPQTADPAASSSLMLAASQFGIRLPAGNGWGSSLYTELLQSRHILGPLALDTLTVPEEGNRKVAVMDLLEVKGKTPALRAEETVTALRRLVFVEEIKKFSGVHFTVTTKWPSVSLAIAKRLLDQVNAFNVSTRQSQAKAERMFVDARVSEAERTLREAEGVMKRFLEQNRVVPPALKFEQDRLEREVTMRTDELTSLRTSRSEAQIREVRDTPVVTVIEPPLLPILREPRESIQRAILGMLTGALLAILFEGVRLAIASGNAPAREFAQALREAIPFLRRPAAT